MNKINKLRNTVQVPAGKEVDVQTPQGVKKYTGGQWVPPSQMNNIKPHDPGSSSKQSSGSGQQKGAEPEVPPWNEIAEQLKMTNYSDPALVNQAAYNVGQFLNTPIDSTSRKIHPLTRFGGQFSLANLTNSIPGLKNLLQEVGLKVQIIHPADAATKQEKILGKNFLKVGELDLKNNTVKFWQHAAEPQDLIKSAAEFITHKTGLATTHYLLQKLKQNSESQKKIQEEAQETNKTLKSYIEHYTYKNKGKMPKPGQDNNIDQLQQKLMQLLDQQQDTEIFGQIVEKLVEDIQKEGGIDSRTDKLLDENPEWGITEQLARILSHANLISLAPGQTIDTGLQQLASTHPETLMSIKQFIDYLNQKAASEDSAAQNP